jgi:periplasmic divalent cation tolerance protein
MRLVMTCVDARSVADSLAGSAVTARLAACAQVGGPVESTYWWQGRVEMAQEWTVLFKTIADRVDALVAHVRDGHPYDTPEIVVLPVLGGDARYLAWVREETGD